MRSTRRALRNRSLISCKPPPWAREAGYDGVEIMGSEGYFLNQFLVTRTNKRTDDWGGSYATACAYLWRSYAVRAPRSARISS